MTGFLGFGKNQNQSIKNQNNIHFELCDCKSEVLVLEYDSECGLMDLAIYEHSVSFRNKMNWYQKLRYIWQVCRYNRPYSDQIVLDKKQIKNLYDFLEKIMNNDRF